MVLETDLQVLEQQQNKKQEENYYFKLYIDQQETEKIDALVVRLDAAISPRIDCTQCGNCCKSLMINVTEPEVVDLAALFNMSLDACKKKYVETSLQNNMIISSIPCHFLSDNRCSIYERRFNECREFPGLHRPGFSNRLFAIIMHYGRCPIVYNVIECLKIETGFNTTR